MYLLFNEGSMSIYIVDVTELVNRKRRVKIRATKDGLCDNFVCSFSGMNTIPAYIVVRVTTCCCCHSASIYHFCISTVNSRVEIVCSSSIPTACFCTILEPCFQSISDHRTLKNQSFANQAKLNKKFRFQFKYVP